MIHLYWHEPAPAAEARVAEWAALGHEARLWTPDDLHPALLHRAQASCERVLAHDRLRHLGNIVRWHLLSEAGGVWADVDVTPLAPLPPALTGRAPWCAALGATPTPFMCGGGPADVWHRCLVAALDNPTGSSPHASGGRLLRRTAHRDEVRLEPAARFTELDARGGTLPYSGTRLTLHDWSTSRGRHE